MQPTAFVCLASAIMLSEPCVAHAQNAGPLAACGDAATQFSVSTDGPAGITAPADGKAAVYLIELYNLRDKGRFNRPTLRAGVDGKWVGATQGLSYVRTEVEPGEHHLCMRWQSHFERLAQEVSLYNFTAAPGTTYYLRSVIVQDGGENGGGPILLDLEPVSTDEGRFLVSEAHPAVSKVK